MKSRLIQTVRNRNFLLALGIVLGLSAGQWARHTRILVLPALGVIMTLASLGVPGDVFRDLRSLAAPFAWGIVMSYLVLTGSIIGLARALIPDGELFRGFVIVAAVPPAVAVVPFTQILGGDTPFTLRAAVGAHLGGLLIIPLIALAFFEVGLMSPFKVMEIVLTLIVVPVAASRVLLYFGAERTIMPIRGALTNWGFFVVIYTIVGLNRYMITHEPAQLLSVAAVAFTITFVLGAAIQKVCSMLGVARGAGVSLVLLGTMKNSGLAAALALSLFGVRAALPASVVTVFMILYFIFTDLAQKRPGEAGAAG